MSRASTTIAGCYLKKLQLIEIALINLVSFVYAKLDHLSIYKIEDKTK